ncbi:hypothetical protein KCU83_g5420, partial [Aureobasidium melanogenum]
MSTRNRTPPLLEPYLRLPSEGSQLLLTGVLDSSPQWLVTRLLRSAFTPSEEPQSSGEQDVTVVLVSWLRDYEFWRSEARRGAVRHLNYKQRKTKNTDASIDDNSTHSTKNTTCEKHTRIAITESRWPTTISRSHTVSRSTNSSSFATTSTTTTSSTTTTTTNLLKPTLKNNLPQRLLNLFNPQVPSLNPLLSHIFPSHPKNPPNPRRTNPPPLNNLHTLRLCPLFSPLIPPFLGVNNNSGS